MPVVIKYFLSFSRSQKYATRSLRSLLSYFYDLSNSRKYFIHHWYNIILYAIWGESETESHRLAKPSLANTRARAHFQNATHCVTACWQQPSLGWM